MHDGAEGSSLWHNTDRVWNVNGCIFKADGNFLNPFFFKKIGKAEPKEGCVFIGSYPNCKEDYMRLKESGVTAILNLMNETDIRMHGKVIDDYRMLAQ